MPDPVTILTSISLGLKLVDQFRELAVRFMGQKPHAPSATVEQDGDSLQIREHGRVTHTITAPELHIEEVDEVRLKALQRRVKVNWEVFNELFAEQPLMAVDERARIQLRMDRIKGELCEDFRELVGIYEHVLGTGLPDHYTLFEVCS
ncbi:MAG: hypothetical protein RL885_20450 [Planctomycetota bacterium]